MPVTINPLERTLHGAQRERPTKRSTDKSLRTIGVDSDALCKSKKPSHITRIRKTDHLNDFLDDLERWKRAGSEVWKT